MGWSQPDEAPSTRPASAMTAGIPQTTKVKVRKMGEGALAGQQTLWHALHVPSHTLPQQLHPSSMHLEQPWQNRSQGLQSRAAMWGLFLLQPFSLRPYRAVAQGSPPPTFSKLVAATRRQHVGAAKLQRWAWAGFTFDLNFETQNLSGPPHSHFDEAGPD